MPLSSQFTIGGGLADAFNAGQQRDLDQDKERQLIQQYQLQNQQSQIMNPLLAQHQQGLNDTLQAQLPGWQGNSASLNAKGQVDSAGVTGNIAEHRSKVLTQLDTDQLTQLKTMGEKFSQAGAYLASIPSATTPAGNTRAMAAQQLAQQFGMSQNSPTFQVILKTDPDKLPALMGSIGKRMAMSSSDFQQKRALEQDRTQALMTNADKAATSRENVARINHENDLKKYSSKLSITLAQLSPEKRLGYLQSIKPDGSDPDQYTVWQDQMADMAKTVNFTNQSKAASLSPALVAGADIPTNASNLQTYTDQPNPRTKAPHSTNDLEAQVRKAGKVYDTSKYEYRVDSNGKVQVRDK